jgi:hypothetical protein
MWCRVQPEHNEISVNVVSLVMFVRSRLSKIYRLLPDEADNGERNYHALEERDNS